MIGRSFLMPYRSRLLSLPGNLLISVLFITFFFSFLSIKLWDYDFWWHISNGRYIVETGSLPDKDPFSFTSQVPENKNPLPERENFILKQYWLGQIMFYLVYDYAGPAGIIMLRASLLALTLLVVYRRLKRWSVSPPVSFIFLFALFEVIVNSSGERPVLFTILFTALIFSIMEGFRERKGKGIFLLLPLMPLWANLHGGFVLGVIIIMTYMFCEGVSLVFKRSVFTKNEVAVFYAASLAAICLSFVNPSGFYSFYYIFSPQSRPFSEGVQEYSSPLRYYFAEKAMAVNYSYVLLAALFPVLLVIRRRKFDFYQVVLLFWLFAASLSALRFIVFYVIIAAMVLGRESDLMIKDFLKRRLTQETTGKVLDGLTVAALLSAVLFMSGNYKNIIYPGFGVAENTTPVAAADFVVRNRLNGNIFNDYSNGGYLTWRLYPWKKNFIDSRTLNLTVLDEYNRIIDAEETSLTGNAPSWEAYLKAYRINIVFLTLFNVYDQVPELVFALSESPDWVPVYADSTSVVFLSDNGRNRPAIGKFRLSRETVYNMIIRRGLQLAISNPVNKNSFIAVGNTFYRMGRLQDALAAYKHAYQRLPSPDLKERINRVESEMKMKEVHM